MERGLLWLPLLAFFIGLAWAGWNEYRKVEAYQTWASGFDRAKYDLYAVLGQKNREITWGRPTRQGIANLQTFSLDAVETIRPIVDGEPVDSQNPPETGKSIALEFQMSDGTASIRIPFTEIPLAVTWGIYLEKLRARASEE
ncbi:MAG TPA: hypothetical protein IGS17_16830 [Oscillatoriales cyanobacterium M59_W2019_021]|nr:MAG: hypothetical protein D6728_02770 [Cyanobacteria bacterium J055]HIK32963.1 hypothetical protein [Oscillatoriales cyanobacterium M4454_W2019_049]HIK52571.1 hypothetical protein [Oscillatoriales cyanobacterium M59_W2019_021]